MRPFHRALLSFLHGAGAECVRLERKGRGAHPRLVFTWKGAEHTVIVPGTSGDRRALKNQISDLKGVMGLRPAPEKPPPAPPAEAPARREPARQAKPQAPALTAFADWRDQLRQHPLAQGTRGDG